jgi:hypothetical protein
MRYRASEKLEIIRSGGQQSRDLAYPNPDWYPPFDFLQLVSHLDSQSSFQSRIQKVTV